MLYVVYYTIQHTTIQPTLRTCAQVLQPGAGQEQAVLRLGPEAARGAKPGFSLVSTERERTHLLTRGGVPTLRGKRAGVEPGQRPGAAPARLTSEGDSLPFREEGAGGMAFLGQ